MLEILFVAACTFCMLAVGFLFVVMAVKMIKED